MRRILPVFALLLLVLSFSIQATEEPRIKVGDSAPEISAKGWLNTQGESLAANSKKLTVVEFWATWCPPCRASIPHLIEMNAKYKDKGVVIVGLSDEPLSKVKPFAEQIKMDYAVGAGSNSVAAYGVAGIPHAFIIADGKVIWHGHPMQGLDKAIEKALADHPPAK